MDHIDEDIMLVCTVLLCHVVTEQVPNAIRRYKTRVVNRRRKIHGFFNAYFLPMKRQDPQQFFKYTRMSVPVFNKLLKMVESKLKTKRRLPDAVEPEERLAITLHYLSQGCSMQAIAWTYHLGHSTIHYIIKKTVMAIWDVLHTDYLKAPSTVEEWKTISSQFESRWNFPHCLGALDGKHIYIQAPSKSGSLYFNYKKRFSIVLLAACDADYFFKLVDIGAYGSENDGGVFKNSVFGEMLDKNAMNVPPPEKLHNSELVLPYALVADDAFPLKNYIMRPYPGRHLIHSERIFNYRLSRARRVIENAFGILVNRWRLLKTIVIADVENIDNFVKAIVCLHNYVKWENLVRGESTYCPPGFVDGEHDQGSWRSDVNPLDSVGRLSANRAARLLYSIRDKLRDYFLSPAGQVPWQEERVTAGIEPEMYF